MTKKGEKIELPERKEVEPLPPEDWGMTFTEHWTREEQIENAVEDGTYEEMRPRLTAKERAKYVPSP